MELDRLQLTQSIETICQLALKSDYIKNGEKIYEISTNITNHLHSIIGDMYIQSLQFRRSIKEFLNFILNNILDIQVIETDNLDIIFAIKDDRICITTINFLEFLHILYDELNNDELLWQHSLLFYEIHTLVNKMPKGKLIDFDQQFVFTFNANDEDSISVQIPKANQGKKPNTKFILKRIRQSLNLKVKETIPNRDSSRECPITEDSSDVHKIDIDDTTNSETNKNTTNSNDTLERRIDDTCSEEKKAKQKLISAQNSKTRLENKLNQFIKKENDFDNLFFHHLAVISDYLGYRIEETFDLLDSNAFNTFSEKLIELLSQR